MEKLLVSICCLATCSALAVSSVGSYEIDVETHQEELPSVGFYEIESVFILTNKEDNLPDKGTPFDKALKTH